MGPHLLCGQPVPHPKRLEQPELRAGAAAVPGGPCAGTRSGQGAARLPSWGGALEKLPLPSPGWDTGGGSRARGAQTPEGCRAGTRGEAALPRQEQRGTGREAGPEGLHGARRGTGEAARAESSGSRWALCLRSRGGRAASVRGVQSPCRGRVTADGAEHGDAAAPGVPLGSGVAGPSIALPETARFPQLRRPRCNPHGVCVAPRGPSAFPHRPPFRSTLPRPLRRRISHAPSRTPSACGRRRRGPYRCAGPGSGGRAAPVPQPREQPGSRSAPAGAVAERCAASDARAAGAVQPTGSCEPPPHVRPPRRFCPPLRECCSAGPRCVAALNTFKPASKGRQCPGSGGGGTHCDPAVQRRAACSAPMLFYYGSVKRGRRKSDPSTASGHGRGSLCGSPLSCGGCGGVGAPQGG